MAETDATPSPADLFEPGARIGVLLPLPFDDVFDYRMPEGLSARGGSFVRVPFGPREVTGVAWGPGSGEIDEARVRDIVDVLDAAPMAAPVRRLVDWTADYTLAGRGGVLRMAMSVPAALEPVRMRLAYRASGATPDRMTDARKRVMALLADGLPRSATEIARDASVGTGVVKGLAEMGALSAISLPDTARFDRPDGASPGPALSPDQERAADALRARVASSSFGVTLLDGVTGSGKTEVYFEAIATALQRHRQVLVMLPEIALGAQWLDRFRRRFDARPAPWHSELGARQRRETWRAVADGRVSVVVGARSALWLPFRDLGLIVIDEEHDAAFKQEDGVVYHARDMAIVRARLEARPVVLVSATPSLESVVNAEAGRYERLHLPARHGGARLPHIEAIDLRVTPPRRGAWLAEPLRSALAEALEAEEQALLFLNRRGYAPLTLCRGCGHRMECPQCSAWLVEHRFSRTLACHHCGHSQGIPTHCPACEAEDRMVACGPGVERVAEEVAMLMPEARVVIATSDTISGPSQAESLIEAVTRREVDVVIGTQMIAKGHHFPLLTVVGVVDADLGLAGGDLRAAERTYQLLHQVAGRAGRAERPGRVLLQTHAPENPVIAALVSGDREAFLAREADERTRHRLPPFGRLAAIVVSSPREAEAMRVASGIARVARRALEEGSGIAVLGPAPAPMRLLRGRHRVRLLFKAAREKRLQPHLRQWLATLQIPARVRVQVDIDPYSFL